MVSSFKTLRRDEEFSTDFIRTVLWRLYCITAHTMTPSVNKINDLWTIRL
jgi:hypothetical protein